MKQGTQAGALGRPKGMRWGGRWGGGHMSTCDWFMSMYGKHHHNFVKYPPILYPLIKNKLILKRDRITYIYLKLTWDSYFYVLKNYTLTEKLTMYVGNYFSRILLISKNCLQSKWCHILQQTIVILKKWDIKNFFHIDSCRMNDHIMCPPPKFSVSSPECMNMLHRRMLQM